MRHNILWSLNNLIATDWQCQWCFYCFLHLLIQRTSQQHKSTLNTVATLCTFCMYTSSAYRDREKQQKPYPSMLARPCMHAVAVQYEVGTFLSVLHYSVVFGRWIDILAASSDYQCKYWEKHPRRIAAVLYSAASSLVRLHCCCSKVLTMDELYLVLWQQLPCIDCLGCLWATQTLMQTSH